MPRFVILEHDHPMLHWDLMLEWDGVLRTWRLSAPPGANCTVTAEAIGDHRLAYLDYEGPVSGNRGSVTRWDWGTYLVRNDSAEYATYIDLSVEGNRFRGQLTIGRAAESKWVLSTKVNSERETRAKP